MDKWSIDSEHSTARFDVRFLFRHMHGQFDSITGSALLDPDDVPHSFVEAVIDTTSVKAEDKTWHTQIRGPYFLDIERYPTISFKSTAIERTGNHHIRISGDLTIRGITNEEVLEAEYTDPEEDAEGKALTMRLTAQTTINREDYGITLHDKEALSLLIGKEIRITLEVRLVSSAIETRVSARGTAF